MKMFLKASIAMSVLLGGCANLNQPISQDVGKFAETNFQAQVIDARPAQGSPEMDAAMSVAAIERYRAGKTKTSSEAQEEGSEGVPLTPSN